MDRLKLFAGFIAALFLLPVGAAQSGDVTYETVRKEDTVDDTWIEGVWDWHTGRVRRCAGAYYSLFRKARRTVVDAQLEYCRDVCSLLPNGLQECVTEEVIEKLEAIDKECESFADEVYEYSFDGPPPAAIAEEIEKLKVPYSTFTLEEFMAAPGQTLRRDCEETAQRNWERIWTVFNEVNFPDTTEDSEGERPCERITEGEHAGKIKCLKESKSEMELKGYECGEWRVITECDLLEEEVGSESTEDQAEEEESEEPSGSFTGPKSGGNTAILLLGVILVAAVIVALARKK